MCVTFTNACSTASLGFMQQIPRPFAVHKLTHWTESKNRHFLSSSPMP